MFDQDQQRLDEVQNNNPNDAIEDNVDAQGAVVDVDAPLAAPLYAFAPAPLVAPPHYPPPPPPPAPADEQNEQDAVAIIEQHIAEERENDRDIAYQVGRINAVYAAKVCPYPNNGQIYMSRVEFDQQNDRLTDQISRPSTFNALSAQMQAKLYENKSFQLIKEVEDKDPSTQIRRENPMSCWMCRDDFMSKDVDQNIWLTLICNSPNCFALNFFSRQLYPCPI